MEPEGSLPHAQELTTCPYPEPAQSSSWPPPFPLLEELSNYSTVKCETTIVPKHHIK
jgi:hypothetical protein